MTKQEFWQQAYLAAIRAGVPQNHFSSIADDAVTQLGSRPALVLEAPKVDEAPATGAPVNIPKPSAKA